MIVFVASAARVQEVGLVLPEFVLPLFREVADFLAIERRQLLIELSEIGLFANQQLVPVACLMAIEALCAGGPRRGADGKETRRGDKKAQCSKRAVW